MLRNILLLCTIVNLYLDSAAACTDITSREIHAAIIVGRRNEIQANYTTEIFSDIDKVIFPQTVKLWKSINAPPCTGLSNGDRGLNIVHKEILHDFYLRKGTCSALFVFEDGAFPAHPEAVRLSVESVHEMTADFLWLGYTYRKKDGHPLQTNYPPSSSHAYAVTHGGALRLFSLIDTCKNLGSGLLSTGHQFQALALDGKISWAVPRFRESALPGYLNKQLERYGLHLSSSLFSDGIFVQVSPDRSIEDIPDGTVGHLHGRKSIWYLYERQWRPVGNMDNFFNLGLDLKNIITFTKAQLKTFPVGSALTYADVEMIRRRKKIP